jgi:hypothetical protein
VSSPTTIPLLMLMFGLVATRRYEQKAWQAGRLSDRVAAWLIVGRLPVLLLGFALITDRDLPVMAVMTAIGLIAAFVLQPIAAGRLAGARARDRGEPPSP